MNLARISSYLQIGRRSTGLILTGPLRTAGGGLSSGAGSACRTKD